MTMSQITINEPLVELIFTQSLKSGVNDSPFPNSNRFNGFKNHFTQRVEILFCCDHFLYLQ
jgi:UTP-glucose-1-phosphate uridylyltransferase